jgi:hypothetical protein
MTGAGATTTTTPVRTDSKRFVPLKWHKIEAVSYLNA